MFGTQSEKDKQNTLTESKNTYLLKEEIYSLLFKSTYDKDEVADIIYDIIMIGDSEIVLTAEEVSKKSALHYEPIIAGIQQENTNLKIDNNKLIKDNRLYKILLIVGIPLCLGGGIYLGLQAK